MDGLASDTHRGTHETASDAAGTTRGTVICIPHQFTRPETMNGALGPRPRLLDSLRPLRLHPLDGEDRLPDPLGSVPLATLLVLRCGFALGALLCIHLPSNSTGPDFATIYNGDERGGISTTLPLLSASRRIKCEAPIAYVPFRTLAALRLRYPAGCSGHRDLAVRTIRTNVAFVKRVNRFGTCARRGCRNVRPGTRPGSASGGEALVVVGWIGVVSALSGARAVLLVGRVLQSFAALLFALLIGELLSPPKRLPRQSAGETVFADETAGNARRARSER
jgi:hypothetical protein